MYYNKKMYIYIQGPQLGRIYIKSQNKTEAKRKASKLNIYYYAHSAF